MSQNVCEVLREVGGPLPSRQGQANMSRTDDCRTDMACEGSGVMCRVRGMSRSN